MRILFHLVRREFGIFWQNKIFVVAFLLMPIALSLVLGFVYYQGKIERLHILVVDEDDSPTSARFVDMLSENNTLYVTRVKRSVVDLEELLLETRAVGVVVIPFRFEANLFTKRVPEINCYLNMGNTLSAGTAGSAIQLTATTLNVGIQIKGLQQMGVPPSIAEHRYEAFHHNMFGRYNPTGNYLYFLWPGLIFSLLHQLLLLATAAGFSQEVSNKTFSDLLNNTRSPFILIIAKIFPYIFLSGFTVAVYLGISVFFRIPFPEHPEVLLLSALLFAIGASMLGTLFSIISPLPVKASQIAMTIGSPALSVSGFTWYSDQIPVGLRLFSEIVPLTPFLRALRLSWIQGASFTDVLPQLYHQLLIAGVYFILCLFLLRKRIVATTAQLKPIPVTPINMSNG